MGDENRMAVPRRQLAHHVSLDVFERFDADLFAVWGESLRLALTPVELTPKTQAVILVALDSVVHWSQPVIEQHINDAFDAGSSILELIEAVEHLSFLDSGVHGLHDGLEALEMVVRKRTSEGLPAPRNGAGLGPTDMTYEARWPNPPVFPYHSPAPRYHNQVLAAYHPKLWNAFKEWNQARFELREELTRKTQELLVTACDTAIYWPEPLLDHHIHAAFEVGATGQEILETMVLAAGSVSGARDTNFAARLLEGSVQAIHHGLTALDRVYKQRESKGLLAPRDRNSPRTGPAALTSGEGDALNLPSSMSQATDTADPSPAS